MAAPYSITDELLQMGVLSGAGAFAAPQLIPVQDREGGWKATPQPPPRVQNVPVPGQRPAAKAPPRSITDELLSTPFSGPQTPPQAAPAPAAPAPTQAPQQPAQAPSPYAEPDAPSWLERRWQDIRGRRDARYQDLPSVTELLAVNPATDAQFKLLGQGDAAYGDFLEKELGNRVLRRFKDANGFDIIGIAMPDGKEQLAYVNKPSWEWNDIDRGVSGAVPYLAGAGVAGRLTSKAPLAIQALSQGLAGATTSAVTDAAAGTMGSNQGIDPTKALVAGGAGMLGQVAAPAIGAAWRRFVVEPRLYNRATGSLTPEGEAVARQAGLDPTQLTQEIQENFAKEFARSGNAKAAGIQAETADVGIPTTLGQRTKDRRQLADEQAMRHGVRGQGPADVMNEFDKRQIAAIESATMGEVAPGTPGMSLRLAPHRSTADYAPGQVGGDIGERVAQAKELARKGEKEAWDNVGPLTTTPEANAALKARIGSATDDVFIDTEAASLTPVATRMNQLIADFVEGKAPAQAPNTGFNPVGDVGSVRKKLSAMQRAAQPGSPDARAANTLYRAFNDWVGEMAETQLLNGDPLSAAAMTTARGVSRELHRVFDGQPNSAGARIMKDILEKVDNPEGIIRSLFVGPSASNIKGGATQALKSLKEAATRYLPKEEGEMLWNDIRLAYWLNQVRNNQGEMYNPQVLLNNLKRSMNSQGSVWNVLYTPQERAFANRIVKALETGPTFKDWTIKINTSNSALVGANLIKDFVGMLWGAIGGRTALARGVVEAIPGVSGYNRARAADAIAQTTRGQTPLLGGPAAAAGAQSGSRE